jgi:hypothetical protein
MTAHPNAEWIAFQLIEACGWSEPPRYVIRDRDGAWRGVHRRLTAMGIRVGRTLGIKLPNLTRAQREEVPKILRGI